jgi:glycogen debranching enzyme
VRWLATALDDLDALRLVTVADPASEFLAAGAPWFFTLFGRDSIWAARFMLPLGTELAGGTLRVLAGLQGTTSVSDTAEQPGKIMHELRRGTLEIPREDISLLPSTTERSMPRPSGSVFSTMPGSGACRSRR